MTYSLADSINVIRPYVSPQLVSSKALTAITHVASTFPPILPAGFECRLGKDSPQVDLHQGIGASGDAIKLLKSHIFSSGLYHTSIWRHLHDFCDKLEDPMSLLHNAIDEIVLEFDLSTPFLKIPSPAVFVTFSQIDPSEPYSNHILPIIETTLKLLTGSSLSLQMNANLSLCVNSCKDGAYITQIGIRLSGEPRVARLNIDGISSDNCEEYLEHIGLKDISVQITNSFKRFENFVDRTVLCIDSGSEIYHKVGFECFFLKKNFDKSRWALLLDELLKNDLCTKSKREALLAWPGSTDPSTSPAPWPGNLIIESLLKNPDTFSIFNRWLSHIKICHDKNQPLEAKGYFGYNHIWADL